MGEINAEDSAAQRQRFNDRTILPLNLRHLPISTTRKHCGDICLAGP